MSGDSFGTLSVHMGADARIGCHSYPDSGPILFIDGGGVGMTVHARTPKRVDAGDVANARALVEAVAVYLAEVERLHAQDNPNTAESAECAAEAA